MDEHFTAEEKRIRRMGAGEASGSIDVKSSVMERVRAIHAQRLASEGGGTPTSQGQAEPGTVVQAPVMTRQLIPPLRPAVQRGRRLAAGFCAVALLGLAGFSILRHVTDQETTGKALQPDFAVIRQTEGQPLALKDSSGRVVAQVKKAESKVYTPYIGSSSARERYFKLKEQYEWQAQAGLQPGETAAYYVNDSELIALMNGLGYGKPLFFTSKTVTYTSYAKLSAAREQAGKWSFALPPERIGQLRFAEGRLFAEIPSSFDPEYGVVLGALKAKTEAAQDGNPLAVTIWPLEDIERAEAVYRDGSNQLALQISWDNTVTTGPVQIILSAGETAEMWSYEDKELLYIPGVGAENNAGSVSRLYWYDSAYGGLAWMTDPPNQRLTREQWETIAAGMVQR
ncbi:hypothetical protein MKZ07_28885 [Paenibacillus sp. FSL P4-0338]|uniref:hypothetical protein n=1 Tax=unclassified Paenibacillus TaxID=185978 RepID=UPI0012EC9C96|nr:hypothetical protein [Paenibacillus sp. FSL R7-269]